ncbi:Metallothionein expression activator [Phlyctochytrium planicorne]|nr:Metallothionein expression activator [Phlyctochytrium planicorne]
MDLLLMASELLDDTLPSPSPSLTSDLSPKSPEIKSEPIPSSRSNFPVRPVRASRKSIRIWEDDDEAEQSSDRFWKSSATSHWTNTGKFGPNYDTNAAYDDANSSSNNTPPQSPCHLPSPSASSPTHLSRSNSMSSCSSSMSDSGSDGYTNAAYDQGSASEGSLGYYEIKPTGNAAATKPVKRYPCKHHGCNRSFTRLFNLKAHMETHNPDRERSFKCEHCGVAFCRAQDLLRHGTVHDKTNLMVCPACPTKTFSRKVCILLNTNSWKLISFHQDALRRHIRVNGCCSLDAI